jgi:acrylyl-CoA reductase (NADPH)
MAVHLLVKLGYRVIASTGRVSEAGYLKSLGATEVMTVLNSPLRASRSKKERWITAVDTVGSHTLANVCASIRELG